MRITDETIDYVSILAKLELSDEAREQAKIDMNNMLDYFDELNQLDTEGVEAVSHVSPVCNVFREDNVVIRSQEDHENTLANAPKQKDGCFVVPKTVD